MSNTVIKEAILNAVKLGQLEVKSIRGGSIEIDAVIDHTTHAIVDELMKLYKQPFADQKDVPTTPYKGKTDDISTV